MPFQKKHLRIYQEKLYIYKAIITNDKKLSFKKTFKIRFEKKNGPNNSILLENTVFVRGPSGNVSIEFKGKKIGNINNNLEPELFHRKNKKYIDEFNGYIKKAKQEFERTLRSTIEQQIGDVDDENLMTEVVNSITDDFILEIQTKIDNIIDENNLKKFIDNEQDPR